MREFDLYVNPRYAPIAASMNPMSSPPSVVRPPTRIMITTRIPPAFLRPGISELINTPPNMISSPVTRPMATRISAKESTLPEPRPNPENESVELRLNGKGPMF